MKISEVRDLPEKEVRDALLARCADNEVGVRHAGGVEVGGDVLFVDAGVETVDLEEIFKRAAALVSLRDEAGEDGARGVDDLRASAVVEGKREGGAGVLRGRLHGPLHGVLHLGGQLAGAADVVHADVVVVHALDVADEVALEQLHKEADLGLGAAQVCFQARRRRG